MPLDLTDKSTLAIIWTSAGILLIEPLGTNFSEILIEIHTFSFKKIHFKMSSGKCPPFCLGLKSMCEEVDKNSNPYKHLSHLVQRQDYPNTLGSYQTCFVSTSGMVLNIRRAYNVWWKILSTSIICISRYKMKYICALTLPETIQNLQLAPGGAIWHWTVHQRDQVLLAWCLIVPSHCLHQYWIIVADTLWN